MNKQEFQKTIYEYYHSHRRSFLWREQTTPYYVLVSEIMLQQTQTFRVAEKFEPFVRMLPNFASLANAPQSLVLGLWKGLGYNRRARYVQEAARCVVGKFGGILPDNSETLETFAGIGPATARSIVTFAYNTPEIFIETNVRAVFLHHFFEGKENVPDKDIVPFVEQALDRENPREWYYALMDYGTMLKKTFKNPARRSKHHQTQNKFDGSFRQLRGQILECLLCHKTVVHHDFYSLLQRTPDEIDRALERLVSEKLIFRTQSTYQL